MALKDITRESVLAAIAEFDRLERGPFHKLYGFNDSKRYWLNFDGRQYPSKAIAGVAHKFSPGESKPLIADDFTGGIATVVKKLRALGFEIEGPAKNPDWTRDELILALDLYFTNPANPPGKTSAATAALSKMLNKLHVLTGGKPSPTFRNPDGVYLKMMNVRALDPKFLAQGKVGMKSGGALEKVLWSEYEGRRDQLAADAKTIRDAIEQADLNILDRLPSADAYEGEEGGVIMRLHKRYERDRKLIVEKLKAARNNGAVSCEVCNFDFAVTYGELGGGYIEVHHLKPVHLMKPGQKTKLTDLALLCANCHRMAHRKREPMSIIELKTAYMQNIN